MPTDLCRHLGEASATTALGKGGTQITSVLHPEQKRLTTLTDLASAITLMGRAAEEEGFGQLHHRNSLPVRRLPK